MTLVTLLVDPGYAMVLDVTKAVFIHKSFWINLVNILFKFETI